MTAPVWLRGTLFLGITLAAGVAIGVGYERRRAPLHDAARMEAHHVMGRLSDALELDSAQQQAIAAILARRQGAVDSTWHVLQPRVHAMLDSTLREITGLLRPEQLAKYRKLVGAMHPGVPH